MVGARAGHHPRAGPHSLAGTGSGSTPRARLAAWRTRCVYVPLCLPELHYCSRCWSWRRSSSTLNVHLRIP